MRDRLEGPILIDSLDRPNAPQTNIHKPPQKPKKDPVVYLALIGSISIFAAGLLIYVLLWAHQAAYYSAFAAFVLYAIQGSVVFVIAGAAVSLVLYLFLRALAGGIWSLDNGVPLPITRLRGDINATALAGRQYDVLTERAKQSKFQGVTTLTLDESSHTETSTTSVGSAEESAENLNDSVIEKDKSVLESLRDKGLINRSDNSILMGFTNGDKA